MAGTDNRKQSLYFPNDMLNEIMQEAIRLDRSLSWVVQHAWRIAAREVGRFAPAEQAAASEDAQVAGSPETAAASEAPAFSSREPKPDPQVREFLRGKFDNTPLPTQG